MRVLICSICAVASCGMAFASPIGEAIGKHLDDGDLPGAVSVVVDAQGRMTVDCRGYAALATKTPMRPDTIFWHSQETLPLVPAPRKVGAGQHSLLVRVELLTLSLPSCDR